MRREEGGRMKERGGSGREDWEAPGRLSETQRWNGAEGQGSEPEAGGQRAGGRGWESQPDPGRDLPCLGPAAVPGRQRTPTSRAWSWPHCGPATGVLGALRATGRVLQETQTLHAVGEAHGDGSTPWPLPGSQAQGWDPVLARNHLLPLLSRPPSRGGEGECLAREESDPS